MSADLARVLEDALKLPEAERADLAACIYASLETATEPRLDHASEVEIRRRVQLIESGQATLILWEEARKRMFRPG